MKTLVKVLSYYDKKTYDFGPHHSIVAVLSRRPAANKWLRQMAGEVAGEEEEADPQYGVKISRTFVCKSRDFPRYEKSVLQSYGTLVYNTLGGMEYEDLPPEGAMEDCSDCSGCGDPDCDCGDSPNLSTEK